MWSLNLGPWYFSKLPRPHSLYLFSEDRDVLRLSSSGVHLHNFYCNFYSACAVTVVFFGRDVGAAAAAPWSYK